MLIHIAGGMSQPGSARTTGDSVPGSGVQFGSGTPRSSSRVPATGNHSSDVIPVLAKTSVSGKESIQQDKKLLPIPKRLFQFTNVSPTLEI